MSANPNRSLVGRPVCAAHIVWSLTVAATVLCGCQAEHRMGLDEFLDMQKAVAAEAIEGRANVPIAMIDQRLGPYVVGPSDVLSVTLTGSQPSILPPMMARVDRDGTVELPIVGLVKVAGLVLEDAEDAIQQAYVPRVYSDAVAHVALTEVDTTNVLVAGAVVMPGLVQLRRTERNMLYALMAAGGISLDASGEATLRRIRQPDQPATYDLTNASQLREAIALDPLENGDIIYVHPAQPNTIFVGGLVNRPAPQQYPPGAEITVLQALAGASGVRTDVTPKAATLVRRMANGRDVHVRLDLERLAMGADPNIMLASGDILWVPETIETKVQDFINRNIFLRAGVSVNYNVTGIEFLNRHSQQSSRLSGSSLQDSYDPLGFLGQNAALGDLVNRP